MSHDKDLVLRTVYLPRDVDDELRELAHQQGTSKNELIRNAVSRSLADLRGRAGDHQGVTVAANRR